MDPADEPLLLHFRRGVTGQPLAAVPAVAQGSLSAIAGTAKDASGAVVPGADITVKNEGTGAENKTVSADNGTFNIPALSIGIYTVTATAPGFKQFVAINVKLEVGFQPQ